MRNAAVHRIVFVCLAFAIATCVLSVATSMIKGQEQRTLRSDDDDDDGRNKNDGRWHRFWTRHVVKEEDFMTLLLLRRSQQMSSSPVQSIMKLTSGSDNETVQTATKNSASEANHSSDEPFYCTYRQYPSRRHYRTGSIAEEPDFLKHGDYIRGQKPTVLTVDRDWGKPCVNQSAWYHNDTTSWPFADGTNPALLSVDRILSSMSKSRSPNYMNRQSEPTERSFLSWHHFLFDWQRYDYLSSNNNNNNKHINNSPNGHWERILPAFLGAVVFKSKPACQWRETPEELRQYNRSQSTEPALQTTMMLLLDDAMKTLLQFSIYIKIDHEDDNPHFIGKHNNKNQFRSKLPSTNQVQTTNADAKDKTNTINYSFLDVVALDDPRLFVHNDNVWISFGFYGGGGSEKKSLEQYKKRQLFAPLHLAIQQNNFSERTNPNDAPRSSSFLPSLGASPIMALVQTSEIVKVCCGRNMAILDPRGQQQHKSPPKTHHDNLHLSKKTTVQPNPNRNNGNSNKKSNSKNEDVELFVLRHLDPVSILSILPKVRLQTAGTIEASTATYSNQQKRQQQQEDPEEIESALLWMQADNLEDQHSLVPLPSQQVHRSTRTENHNQSKTTETPKIKKMSHFHGNNGFLPYIAEWDEYLGIGHFHRPRQYWSGWEKTTLKASRITRMNLTKGVFYDALTSAMSQAGRRYQKFGFHNDYAPYGHHYTHAFYTLDAQPPHSLKRLSNEFVFPSKFPLDNNESSGDMVQFVTSLEIIQTAKTWRNQRPREAATEHVLIGYGINDCESSVVQIELNRIKSMLQKVKDGQQVADLMTQVDGNLVTGK